MDQPKVGQLFGNYIPLYHQIAEMERFFLCVELLSNRTDRRDEDIVEQYLASRYRALQ